MMTDALLKPAISGHSNHCKFLKLERLIVTTLHVVLIFFNMQGKEKQLKKVWSERKVTDNLVKFSVESIWAKLVKKAPELQRIDGNNLSASSLPAITEN